jgi:hypothetical protein
MMFSSFPQAIVKLGSLAENQKYDDNQSYGINRNGC